MDVLHLVPAMLLCAVLVWLLWPVIVEPILRRARMLRRSPLGSADRLADGLFGTWSEHGRAPGLVRPARRG